MQQLRISDSKQKLVGKKMKDKTSASYCIQQIPSISRNRMKKNIAIDRKEGRKRRASKQVRGGTGPACPNCFICSFLFFFLGKRRRVGRHCLFVPRSNLSGLLFQLPFDKQRFIWLSLIVVSVGCSCDRDFVTSVN